MSHPNRLPFEGVLTYVDRPSDKPPSGARGHIVVLTREAAEAALPSLLGMAVDYKDGWDGHDARQKVGIIDEAWIHGDAVCVKGYIFARDFPEIVPVMSRGVSGRGVLGMSYELADAHVDDMRQRVWVLSRATFTGAAILLCWKAAYRKTSVRLVGRELAIAAAGVEMRSIVDEETCGEETQQREEGRGREETGEESGKAFEVELLQYREGIWQRRPGAIEYREGAD